VEDTKRTEEDKRPEVAKLRSLAQLDADAVGAYDAAISRVEEPLIREKLNEFRIDHLRHLQDLNVFIQQFGGEPVQLKPDLKGAAMKMATAASSLMGTHAALAAMLGNEEFANRAYEYALRFEWSGEVRGLIQRNREDERRHLAWIQDSLKDRLWGVGRTQVHA
jgi:rubrerythrin